MHSAKSGLTNSDILLGVIIGILLVLFSRIGVFQPLYAFFGTILNDFQTTNLTTYQTFQNDWSFFWNLSQVKDENERLTKENFNLNSDKALLQKQIDDLNSLLKQQQDFDLKFDLEPVRVVRYLDSQTEIIINKGSKSSIKIGQPVVLGKNIVGIVNDVMDSSSRVELITAPGIRLPVILLESKTKGFIKGDGANGIILFEVPNDKNILVDDQLFTSGNDLGMPYGLIIGKVANIKSDPAKISQEAEVISNVNFNDFSELFVVIN